MLPEYISNLLNKIAKNEGFLNFKIQTEAGTSHGDNLMGILSTRTAITISGIKAENGKTEELKLYFKVPSTSEVRIKNFQSKLLFNREIYVYSTLFPDMIKFQQEKGLSKADSFMAFPKMYACDIDEANDQYVLIMEDLRNKDYVMWSKENVIPLDHELLILRELGKLHGVAFAMKDQRPNQYEEHRKKLQDHYVELCILGKFKSFSNKSIERAANALTNPEHKKLMENFRHTYSKTIADFLLGEKSQEYGIIGHGDFWIDNLLFQYADSERKQLQSLRIVDWQITRAPCPPVFDLYFNTFSCTDKSFRDEHYDTLLKTYYASVSETIRKLGSDPDKLYTWKNLQAQLRNFGLFALWCGPLIIQLNVASAKDMQDLDEYAESIEYDDEIDLIRPYDEETQARYSKWINELVSDLIDYGYVQLN